MINTVIHTDETKQSLNKPLVAIESFIEMANLSWDAEGEIPPNLEDALSGTAKENGADLTHLKGYRQLKLMEHSFVAENAKGCDAVLEMTFTDIGETHHFVIRNNQCDLHQGESDNYTTKISTPYDVWMKISNQEIDGSQAMIDGLYKVEGSIPFLMKMGKLFGGESEEASDKVEEAKSKDILGIAGNKWMGVLFIPWIISWIAIGFSSIIGIGLPLVLVGTIAGVKHKHGQVTYFEKTSFLYFSILAVVHLIGISVIGHHGVIMNYFSMAIIWLVSLLDGQALTSDYSKHEQEMDISSNPIFIKTNNNLTLFWSLMFTIQGILFVMLYNNGLQKFAPLLYLLTVLALKFTKWYSKWYPEKIIRG